jgi:monoamine oxidase
MTMDKVDVCIIGAGLSGACIARALASHNKTVLIIDVRSRVGGRLLTAESGCDMGGMWLWPRSEHNMANLLQELNIETVPMHLDGISMAYTSDGKRHVIPDGQAAMYAACGGGALRIRNGASKLVTELLREHSVQLGMQVTEIDYVNKKEVKVKCVKIDSNDDNSTRMIICSAVVIAAPPKVVAKTIQFVPNLPKEKVDSMIATPTWMQDYGKVAVSFHTNWWRQQGLSGVSIDHVGAVATWWEACSGSDNDGTLPTLAGFVTEQGAEVLHKIILDDSSSLFEYILESLRRVYGVDYLNTKKDVTIQGTPEKDGLIITNGSITVSYKSWLQDAFTNAQDEGPNQQCERLNFTCDYGDELCKRSIDPLFFAGTETAAGAHGHMEGAVIAAERASAEVLHYLCRE